MSSEEITTENNTQSEQANQEEKVLRSNDIDELNQIIDTLEAEKNELTQKLDKIMRAYADAENRMKRAEKDKLDAIKFGPMKMARDLLEVADNFERALKVFPETDDEKLKEVLEGITLTEKSLHQILGRHGIQKIDTQNATFDPNMHETITQVPMPDKESGTIIDVIRNGYMMADRLLRPAQVVTVA